MVQKKVIICDPLGLHLRPAGKLCKTAMEYESHIMIHFRNKEFNAKSLLGILSACIRMEDEIEIICKGADEQEALKVLTELLQNQQTK